MEQKKRKAIVVAQIGANGYLELGYGKVEEKEDKLVLEAKNAYVSGYSFEAVCNRLRQENLVGDEEEIRVLLVGTKSSCWWNLCAYYRYHKTDLHDKILQEMKMDLEKHNKDIKIKRIEDEKQKPIKICNMEDNAIRQSVEAYLNQCETVKERKIRFSLVIVEHGLTDVQLESNFGKIREAIRDITKQLDEETEVELCFDISMGYRSLPMYVYNLANYLTRLENRTYNVHVYYGMEAIRDKDCIEIIGYEYYEDNYRPLIDLHKIEELTRWTNVVNEFNEYGSVRGLVKMLESADEEEREEIEETIKVERKKLADMFSMFDYASNANNLVLLEKSIVNIIFACSDSDVNLTDQTLLELKYKVEDMGLSKEAELLLEMIGEDFANRFLRINDYRNGGNNDDETNMEIKVKKYGCLTIQLSKWFLDQGRIGNAAIAVQEGLITYALGKYSELFNGNLEKWDDYGERNKVKQHMLDMVAYYIEYNKEHANEKISNILTTFDYVRNNIRNVNSHIGYENEKTDAQIKEGKRQLENLVHYALREIGDANQALERNLDENTLENFFQDYIEKIKIYIQGAIAEAECFIAYAEGKRDKEKKRNGFPKSFSDFKKSDWNTKKSEICAKENVKSYLIKINTLENILGKIGKPGGFKDEAKTVLIRMAEQYIDNCNDCKNKKETEAGEILRNMIRSFDGKPFAFIRMLKIKE